MPVHKDDLPMPLSDKELFESYHAAYTSIYGEEPNFRSDKYREFVVAMQLIRVTESINAFNRAWRTKNDMLTEEEKEDAKKWDDYLND